MNNVSFISYLAQFLILIPSAILCYLPMKGLLKITLKKLCLLLVPVLLFTMIISAYVCSFYQIPANTLLLPLVVIFYFCYDATVTIGKAQSLSIYLIACTLLSYPGNFAYIFDIVLHPDPAYNSFSLSASLFQLALTSAMVSVIIYPSRKFVNRMIEDIPDPSIWMTLLPIPLLFLGLNLVLIPQDYAIFKLKNGTLIYILSLSMLLTLFLFIITVYYIMVETIIDGARKINKLNFLEMQERQYQQQQKYIEETQKLRHDFRQSLITMKTLYDAKDYDALDEYAKDFFNYIPINEIQPFCANYAINALLNYYWYEEKNYGIKTNWDIRLPKNIPISEVNLCTLLGNILKNVLEACQDLDEEKRYHNFVINVHYETYLVIASTNSFDGTILKHNNKYITTKQHGHGLGLSSIDMTAKQYNGSATFTNTDTEFNIDIMLKLK